MHKHKPKPQAVESSRQKFVKNGLRAVRRSESYNFRSNADCIPISTEMGSIHSSKTLSFAKAADFWSDRYSILAAPFGAEMYLSCERSMPETVLGGSRYYMHELLEGKEPNARPRFPYDNTAQQAAKTVTAQYKKNLRIRHDAAKRIQAMWRGHRVFIEMAPIFLKRAAAAAHIHREYREKKYSLVAALRHRSELQRRSLMPKPRPPAVSQEEVDRRYREKLAIKLTSFIKMIPKLLRKQRGRRRRLHIHATRLQSLYRGNKARDRIWKIISAQIIIACAWRRFFKRKYTLYILKIQRTYLNYLLRCQVVVLQRMARGFFHRRRAFRLHLAIASAERLRGTLERSMLADFIQSAAKSFLQLHGLEIKQGKFRKWKKKMSGKIVDPAPSPHIYHTLSENMLFFDPAEIGVIQSHVINVKQGLWPKGSDITAGGAEHGQKSEDETPVQVVAYREKIGSVFSRYEYIKGKYFEASKPQEPEPQEEESVATPSSTKSKKSVKSSSRQGRSSKPGSANTGKFQSGPHTPSSGRKSANERSSQTPPTSAKSVKSVISAKSPSSKTSGARNSSSAKSSSSKVGSAKSSPSKISSSAPRARSTEKVRSGGYSAKGFVHDDWAEGSIRLGPESDIQKPFNPDEYYNKKEKLLWIMLDGFTNWKHPRIDGFAMLICQEYLQKRLDPKEAEYKKNASLWTKLLSCIPKPKLPPPKIYSEPDVVIDTMTETSLIEGAQNNEPGGPQEFDQEKSSTRNAVHRRLNSDDEGVIRLGLDTVGGGDSEGYQIDVLPVDNWGLMSPTKSALESEADTGGFGWSPGKDSAEYSDSRLSSPSERSLSTKRANVYDSTTAANPTSTDSVAPSLPRSNSKLVSFMGTKRTVPPESRRSGKGDSSKNLTSRAVSPISVKKPVVGGAKDLAPDSKREKSKKSNRYDSFDSAKSSYSMFVDASEALRPTSTSKVHTPTGSDRFGKDVPKSSTSSKSKIEAVTSIRKSGSSKKSSRGSSEPIIPEVDVAATRQRLKFVFPPVIPESPRLIVELPTKQYSIDMDLYKIWDRNKIFMGYLPTKDVQFSAEYWSRLPDAVVAKAIFVRKWTLYFENMFKIFLERHRARHPPRRQCPRCLMPSYVDIRRDHECSGYCFPLSWVSKSTWDPAVALLVEACNALTDSKFDTRLWKQIGAPKSQ